MIKVPLWIRDLLKRDGSRILTSDWDIGNGRVIQADKVRARDGDGLALYEDGGAGIFVKDGGNVGIGTTAPGSVLDVLSSTNYQNIRLTTDKTNSTPQRVGLLSQHYTAAEEALTMITGYAAATANVVGIGGGDSSSNAATDLRFYTGITSTTLTGTRRITVTSSGNVGIGTSAPGNPLAVNRSADGIIVDFESADTVEGNVSIAGNTTSYNAFMGSHYTQLKDGQKTPAIGTIVIATGEIIPCESNIENPDKAEKGKEKSGMKVKTKDVSGVERKEYFSYVELASQKADKRVYGVYHAKLSDDAKGQSFGEDNKAIHQIAALGLYKVRVTDTNGDIATGDYIQSSIRTGEGERQDDDILHNYTVAKSIIDINWSEVTVDLELDYKWQLIPATLHCG